MVKDQDYLEKKASYCLDLAKKLGATDASVNVGSSISETVNFRNKRLDASNRSDNLGVNNSYCLFNSPTCKLITDLLVLFL